METADIEIVCGVVRKSRAHSRAKINLNRNSIKRSKVNGSASKEAESNDGVECEATNE